jgi:hypothetical protein
MRIGYVVVTLGKSSIHISTTASTSGDMSHKSKRMKKYIEGRGIAMM